MIQTNKTAKQFSLVVRNRPGELAKLTKFLSDEMINVSALQVANLGTRASIQFETRTECNLRKQLRKTGLRAYFA